MGERRASVRQKSFLRGCLYFLNRSGSVECLIRDLSPMGARIAVPGAVPLPEVVDLHIPQQHLTLRARVERRHGGEMGLAFSDVAAAIRPLWQSGELEQRVARVEAEVAALRRLMKRVQKRIENSDDGDPV